MLEVRILVDGGHGASHSVATPALIGRGEECQVRLRHWRVARQHARLAQRPAGVFVEDHGSLSGTHVNGRRIVQYGPLLPEDEIVVGVAMLRVRPAQGPDPAAASGGVAAASADFPGPRNPFGRMRPMATLTRQSSWSGGAGCMCACSMHSTCAAAMSRP